MSSGTTNTQFAEALKPFVTALASIVNEFNFSDLIKCLSQKGEKLTQFLRLILQALMKGKEIVIGYPQKVINLKKFDPEKLIGRGWKIIDQDERVRQISEIDLNDIILFSPVKEGETSTGEERLKRLKKDGRILLDFTFLLFILENPQLVPENWKETIDGRPKLITFDGNTLLDPNGRRYMFYVLWSNGELFQYYEPLDTHFGHWVVSALLPVSKK
ncbi:MAG: hypothetical protein ACOZAJ_04545 [Patescibacteria group bacterium]